MSSKQVTSDLNFNYADCELASCYIIPQILPDEILHSYLTRFALVNGIRGIKFTKAEIENTFLKFPTVLPSKNFIGILEKITTYSPEYLLTSHSLNHISFHKPYVKNGDSKFSSSKLIPRYLKEGIYHCSICSSEDIRNYGTSYWRTTHQLYAVEHCLKHNHRLLKASSDSLFSLMPHMLPSEPQEQPCVDINTYEEFEIIERYSRIVHTYLMNRINLDYMRLAYLIRRNCDSKGLFLSAEKECLNLRKFLASTFPVTWLDRNFSHILDESEMLTKSSKLRFVSGFCKTNIHLILLLIAAILPNIDINELDLSKSFK